jgi:hypothetical protein
MSILIFALVVVIVCALIFAGVQQLKLQTPFERLLLALILIIAALAIAERAGLL